MALVRPHDIVRTILAINAPELGGVDMAASLVGLHRVYRVGANVYVQRSGPAGASWAVPVLVASDADEDAIPTVCASHDEHLFVCYHDASDVSQIYVSADWGASWSAWSSMAGRYPRMACALADQVLVNWSGGSLRLSHSQTFMASVGAAVETIAVAEQLAAISYTWQEWAALVYEDAGDLYRRLAEDGGVTWGTATLLATGRKPTAARFFPDSVVNRWTGAVGSGVSFVTLGASSSIPEQYIGLAGRGQEVFGVGRDTGGGLHTFWLPGGDVSGDWLEI